MLTLDLNLKKVSGIYSLQNIKNNKVYIGKSNNLYRRLAQHRADLRNNHHSNSYLQNSFNKYGEESFQIFIIETCEEKDLPQRESHYISNFKSLVRDSGYNLAEETETGTKHSQETKDKIRLINLGTKRTEETKQKQSFAAKGKPKSAEHRANIAKAKLGTKSTKPAWNKGLTYSKNELKLGTQLLERNNIKI